VIEEIIEHSGTPYFCFKDIDENKPAGSIKIRIETIAYFLKRYKEDMADARARRNEIDRQLAELEARLRRQALRDHLADLDHALVRESFEFGHLPKIDVTVETLANSSPISH
ncbi:MAG: hypothetical protein HY822_11485, partial [Acidobacteria bacterium]|nr:hypothetical protein [Acidobacteriota bacterium]